MVRLAFLALGFGLIASASAQTIPQRTSWDRREFTSANGKRPDPCHIGLNVMNSDCPYNQMPQSSNTLLAPAQTSNGLVANFFTVAATRALSLNGHYLAGINSVALSNYGGRCSSVDLSTRTAITANTASIVTFQVPPAWMSTALELEEQPRSLCFSTGGAASTTYIYTGFHWKVVWNCNVNDANQQCPPPVTTTNPAGSTKINTAVNLPAGSTNGALGYGQWPMNSTYILRRSAMTTCCSNSVGSGSWQVGQCVNAATTTCCGASAVPKQTARCCASAAYETSQWNDAPCPCYQSTAGGAHCPTGETCCLPSKYPELALATNTDLHGECYNASSNYQCCDTGKRFDPGSSQCCPINGVQSLDVPCPCGRNADCIGNLADTTDDANFICCQQNTPTLWEAANQAITTTPATACNKYANYPNGTGPYNTQPCLGSCIDQRYQICCNGASCINQVEYCCNSTCCNRFVGTCVTGRRPGAPGAWQNGDGFGQQFLQCSTVEQMNPIKAFWVFVLPTELMLATFLALAICLAFASRATDTHKFSIIEKIMIVVAFLTILFAVTLFFAPVFKYGIAVAVVSLLAIITASARVRWLNGVCIILLLLVIFYLFDFVHGNQFLNMASNRQATGTSLGLIANDTMGVLHTTRQLFSPYFHGTPVGAVGTPAVDDYHSCTKFYNYFKFDTQIRDFERFDNPQVTTFGYCSRAWVVALHLFEGAIVDLLLLQLVLAVLALIQRFKESSYDPVVLTVMEGQEPDY